MTLQYANNANSSLNNGIAPGATSFTVVTGGGAKFPAIGTGPNTFYVTITDAATEVISEIFLCTALVGDVFTVVGAQQGTASQGWNAGDIVAQLVTAGDMAAFIQTSNVLANPTAAVGLTAVNGSASTGMRSDGAPYLSQAITPTWTGAHTFSNNVTMNGATNTIAGTALNVNTTLTSFNDPVTFGAAATATFDGDIVTPIPKFGILYSSDANAPIDNITVPTVVGNALTWQGTSPGFQWTPVTTTSDFTGSNHLLATNGYQVFPGGLIMNWGLAGPFVGREGAVVVSLLKQFPNALLNAVATIQNPNGVDNAADQSAQVYISDAVTPIATLGVYLQYNGGGASTTGLYIYWQALGY
jgi:hypothetical protein